MEIIWSYILVGLHVLFWFGVLGPALRRNLRAVPRLPLRVPRRTAWPRVTAIVPARNEERALEASLRSLLAQTYPGLHIVCANDGSTDRTRDIAAALAREFPGRLTLVDVPDLPDGWLGKPHAQHHAVQNAPADTDIYLFTDADVIHEPATLHRAVAHLLRERGDLLAIFPRVDCVGVFENATMPLLVHIGLAANDLRKLNDPKRRTAVGIGAFTMLRRGIYERFGGHAAIRGEVIDDMALGLKAKQAAGKLCLVRDPNAVHLRMYHGGAEIVRGFEKNVQTAIGGGVVRLAFYAALWLGIHLLPVVAALHALTIQGSEAKFALFLAACIAFATGETLAARTRSFVRGAPLLTALFYPLGVLLMLAVFVRAAWHSVFRRTVRWRGRTTRIGPQQVRML